MAGFERTPPNLLPVDAGDGGQAVMRRWFRFSDGQVAADNGQGGVMLGEDEGVSTSPITENVAPLPIPVTPGETYTAGVSCDGLVIIAMQWVGEDGTVAARVFGWGVRRAAVTATCPANITGVIVAVFNPTFTITAITGGVLTVDYYRPLQWPDAPALIVGVEPPGPILISDPVLARTQVDPGPVPPTVADTSFGAYWWASLPRMYRDTDEDRVLRRYLAGVGAAADQVSAVRNRLDAGDLTSPAAADDAWVPWLAQVVGVPVSTAAETRRLLIARGQSPAVGTRPALAALAQTYLTGTRQVSVVASSEPWTILLRVRADEAESAGGPEGVVAKVLATGQVPAGFTVRVDTAQQTWDQIDSAVRVSGGKWAGIDGPTQRSWAFVDSLGLPSDGSTPPPDPDPEPGESNGYGTAPYGTGPYGT
ncbi:hypothetical protein [Nakamurella leprariae]|uniref:Uncharacterized protein n=1 Tax=Nakamurella leprariae TaxID=2803911 RepID=A0A938YAY0_9ACTN|nr:hypothetical protein [Nakamurella leprariae]MBM9467267.1 hypothetical protein [Nakamurella leprariae]